MTPTEHCTEDGLCDLAKTRFFEMDKRIEARFHALEDSIDKAESILNVRLEGINQFRQQVENERLDYVKHRESLLMNVIISIVIVFIGLIINHLAEK